MSLRLRHEQTTPIGAGPATTSAGAGPEAPASISGWLGMFSTMLPRRQAEGIREELEAHLRERVRDLMVGGLNEAESTKRAIAEFGEAAELAGKYRALTNEPRRRIIMYGSIFAMAGAALALSVAAVSGGKGQAEMELAKAKAESAAVKDLLFSAIASPQPEQNATLLMELAARTRNNQVTLEPTLRVFDLAANRESTIAMQPDLLQSLKFDVKFEATPAIEVLKAVEQRAGIPVSANWKVLGEAGLESKTPITLRAEGAAAHVILRALNEATGVVGEGPIDWRVSNGVIEIGLRDSFDKREIKLVIYELEGIIAARQQKYDEERAKVVEEVVTLVREFVYPDGWRDNGGELAKMTVVGDRMFVEAPERFHKQIRWMLEQLPGQKAEGRGALPASREHDIRRIPLKAIAATEALTLIGQAMNISPGLGTLDGGRVINASVMDNAIILNASEAQSAAIRRMLELIDLPEGEVRGGPESRKFTLGHVSPRALREFLGRVFNASPGLKQCAVPRVMSCDESDRLFELTATPDQVETVAKLIALVDQPGR